MNNNWLWRFTINTGSNQERTIHYYQFAEQHVRTSGPFNWDIQDLQLYKKCGDQPQTDFLWTSLILQFSYHWRLPAVWLK